MTEEQVKEKLERTVTFKKAIDGMIAINENAYNYYNLKREKITRGKVYTREEIQRIITSGTLSEQVRLSYSSFYRDGFYRRILIHYATLLKYMGLLIPKTLNENNLTTKAFNKKYRKILKFLDKVKIPKFCSNAAIKALIYGSYYGLIVRADDEHFVVLDLPFEYCDSNYKDYDGNDLIEFNLSYFNTIKDLDKRQKFLEMYPVFIQEAYERFINGEGRTWIIIPPEFGICFSFIDGKPPLLNILPASLDYEQEVANELEKSKEEIKKIIVQKIEHDSANNLLFEPEEAEAIHKGTVNMLKHNKNLSVLTTYGEVKDIGSNTTNDKAADVLEKMMYNIYYEAGTTSQLFGTNSNLSIEYSIKNDAAFMMRFLVDNFSIFLTNLVNRLYGNSTIFYKYEILPITFYNEKEFIENTYKLATSGYSFLIPALTLGITQQDLCDLKVLENTVLKLQDYLVPLQTSYTQSGSDGKGRPTSDNKDLSPMTEVRQEVRNKS